MKTTNFNDIEKLILNGSFLKESCKLKQLNDREINYFLYFSLKNKKYESFEFFLNNWNYYYFNKNKNILSLLSDNIFNSETIILDKIKNHILIEDKYLDFYEEKINKISIPNSSFNHMFDRWEDFISFKRKENLLNNLNKKLTNNKLTKGIKI